MTTPEPLVDVQDLSVHYALAKRPALRGVSLHVEPGELLAVCGRHSAGKSTLAYTLMGLIPHAFNARVTGRVRVAGRDPIAAGVPALAGVVGLCLQNPYNQISGARETVFDEVAFGLENLGVPREEIAARTEEVLGRFGLLDVARQNPYACSGGQVQRLAIAGVWALRPQVLVLDEPVSQLDPQGAREVEQAVETARAQGVAVVLIEHRAEWLAARADRVLVLEGDAPPVVGPARTVFADPSVPDDALPRPVYATVAAELELAGAPPLTENEALPLLEGALTRPVPEHATPPGPASTQSTMATAPTTVVAAAASPAPRVDIEGVRFGYEPTRPVIPDLDLHLVGPGIVALLGQNGGGKSTILRLLLGLAKPWDGRVRLAAGERVLDTREHTVAQVARLLALAFQNPDDQLFLPSVRREAEYGARNIGREAAVAQASAAAALRALGLTAVADTHPYDLGFGLRKLVSVASAVAMDTPILVLDEPTMAQDHASLRRLAALVRHLAARGKLVLMVTHDMAFAAEVADRTLVLAGGRLLADGPPNEVFGRGDVLAQAGLEAPPAARLAMRLGLGGGNTLPVAPKELVRAIIGA